MFCTPGILVFPTHAPTKSSLLVVYVLRIHTAVPFYYTRIAFAFSQPVRYGTWEFY